MKGLPLPSMPAMRLRLRPDRKPLALSAVIGVLLLATACGGGSSPVSSHAPALRIVVSAPISTERWVANFMGDGASLAAQELNRHGGVKVGSNHDQVVVQVLDNAGSATAAVADARRAVAEKAAALIIDGVGANAVSQLADSAHLPVFVVFDGGSNIINPKRYPTTYRMAPADVAMAMRLADYLAAGHPKVGLIDDTTDYGTEGAAAMSAAFHRDQIKIVSRSTVPADASDAAAQVLAARRAGATMLSVWASAPLVAAVITDARQAGWSVPIWAGPTGEDPLVRQRLADHSGWLTGVGFVSFRITAEVGPPPYNAFRAAYTRQYGEQRTGLSEHGKPVVQPPDWAMFPFDAVRLVAAAATRAGTTSPALQQALNGHVVITGANGDERGFTPANHEGVSPDDMYFAQFHGFVFQPVTNDPLSVSLPTVNQIG